MDPNDNLSIAHQPDTESRPTRASEPPMPSKPPPATPAEAFQIARDSDAPINERLATYATTVRAMGSPAYAIVDRLVERLKNAGAGLNAPAVGEPMPPSCFPTTPRTSWRWRICSPAARWPLRSTADIGVRIAASTPM